MRCELQHFYCDCTSCIKQCSKEICSVPEMLLMRFACARSVSRWRPLLCLLLEGNSPRASIIHKLAFQCVRVCFSFNGCCVINCYHTAFIKSMAMCVTSVLIYGVLMQAKRFTPFGNGIRNCVGQQLALSNVPTGWSTAGPLSKTLSKGVRCHLI